MKKRVRSTIWFLVLPVISSLVIGGLPRITIAGNFDQGNRKADYQVKNGRDVVGRVRMLRENNKNIRAALRSFETRGYEPRTEDSFAITGALPVFNSTRAKQCPTCGWLQPASFQPQSTIDGDGVELIFVPTVSIAREWQGTVIATRYDSNGSFIDQYVANSILVMRDPNTYRWDEVYEAPVEAGVVQDPINEPGMYTNVELGTPLQQQSDQLTERQNNKRDSLLRQVRLMKASVAQGGQARIRGWARCSFAWCAGAGVACVGANIWNAELLAGPCFAAGCGASMIGCTWGTIWR
jgi:hypothetical protein